MSRRIVPAALAVLLVAAVSLVGVAFAGPEPGADGKAVSENCQVTQGSDGCCVCNVLRWKVKTCCPGNPCETNYYCLWGTCCGPGNCCA